VGATISDAAALHMWAEARKVTLHHILKYYTNNNICLKHVKIAKKDTGAQVCHTGRKHIFDDKRMN
jgi:hypothetical protein